MFVLFISKINVVNLQLCRVANVKQRGGVVLPGKFRQKSCLKTDRGRINRNE